MDSETNVTFCFVGWLTCLIDVDGLCDTVLDGHAFFCLFVFWMDGCYYAIQVSPASFWVKHVQ